MISSSISAASTASTGAARRCRPQACGVANCRIRVSSSRPASRTTSLSEVVGARSKSEAQTPICSEPLTSSTRSRCRIAKPQAAFTAVVDLPTPPLLLTKETIRPTGPPSRAGARWMRRSNSESSLVETGRRRKSFTPARIARIKIALSDTSAPKPSGRKTAATVVSGEMIAASSANACKGRTSGPISIKATCGRRLRAASIAWRTSAA